MNYYSPYFSYAPYTAAPASKGILSSIFGGVKSFNWSGLLSNVQKTLGIVNQAIPMVKQVSPIVNNAKTMFKIMNEFNDYKQLLNYLQTNSDSKYVNIKFLILRELTKKIFVFSTKNEIHIVKTL